MINFLLFILVFFLFFSYALVSLQLIFAIIAVGVVVIFFIKKFDESISISLEDQIWLLCIVITVIGLIRTPSINESGVFLGFILVFVLLKIGLSNLEDWKEVFIKGSLFFSSIHVFSTLIQYFNPQIVKRVTGFILPDAAYNVNSYQLSVGKYAGITSQVGANAFFITIFLAIIFCYLVENKKKKFVAVILLIVGFIALLLTTKRGLLLFNITTLITIVLITKFRKFKKGNKIILFLLVMLIVGLLIVTGVSLISNSSLWSQLFIDDDITSGRMGIYSSTLELVKSAPLIGNGLSSVEYKIGIKTHNIYLQLWAELGLIGLVTYLLAMVVTLRNSIKLYFDITKEEYKKFILVSIYIQIIFLLYGLTGNVLYDYFILGIYMIAISLSGAARVSWKKL